MKNRYVYLWRLPRRQYAAGCPAVLAAGALLRDTEKGTAAAQLKFCSIWKQEIAALTVSVECLDREGKRLGAVEFTYEGLAAKRGEAFGHYKAIPLPDPNTARIRTVILSVSYQGGEWELKKGDVWGILPGFWKLHGRQLRVSRRLWRWARYAYAEPADLWYCTCGTVNRKGEKACCHCGAERGLLAMVCAPGCLDEPASPGSGKKKIWFLAGGAAAAALLLAVSLPKKEAGEFPQESKLQAAEAEETQPQELAFETEAVETRSAGEKAAASENGKIETGTKEHEMITVTAPNARPDDSIAVYVPEDENGDCWVSPELIKTYIPESTTCCFSGAPNLGEDIDEYIKDSFSFACLVADGVQNGISGEGDGFNPYDDPDSTFCLLVFQYRDGRPYLTGYYVGVPEKSGEDTWLLQVTPCEYDLTDLCSRETEDFQAEKDALLSRCIEPEDIGASGAAYYIKGYNTGKSADIQEDDCQMYHVWNQLHSSYRNRFAREISRIERDAEKTRSGRWKCFLLLDEDYEQIGYTVIHKE